ncbi:MAG TPA: hypothetical protein VFB23_00595 [Candidatus Acidoferrales bacterium]|jgi:hypothetical protein|nr:hypothetical protein [Candidatus Acidoferrales bacterium]
MPAVAGVFKSRSDAERGVAKLRTIGVPTDRINVLTPHATEQELAAVPTSQGEQPGMVKTLTALTGGALGAGIGEMVATMILPGVGFVLALGIAGGALLGIIGGGAVGSEAEKTIFASLPEEELFVYEDALRHGRSLVIARVDDQMAEAARGAFDDAGAESVDRAREMWWIGLRDVEKEHYSADGKNFEEDEPHFRSGFEGALLPGCRDKSYDQARESLRARYPDRYDTAPFRHGYERGIVYRRALQKRRGASSADM